MTRALVAGLALLCIAACTSKPPPVPENVGVGLVRIDGPPERREPIVAPNNAPPQIKSMWFNALEVCRRPLPNCKNDRGNEWSGRFLTSTNVASLEVRTNLFSIDVPRTDFGKFAFTVNVLDLPPIFIRDYRVRVIARNSAGLAYEEDLPFRIR